MEPAASAESHADSDRLVRAAWGVLERTGFEGFKVAAVIRAAGSSTKTFYRCFGSKENLLLALLTDETSRAGVRIRSRVDAATSPVEAVRIWIATMIGSAGRQDLAARARLFASLGQISHRFPAEVIASRRCIRDPLRSALSVGSDNGVFATCDPDVDAGLIMSVCSAVLRELLDGTAGTDVEAAIADTQDFVLRSLGADPRVAW